MATYRDKLVTLNLNYGAVAIVETQFDIPLIFCGHNATGNVVDVFTSSDEVLAAGFTRASAAYKMAKLLFDGLYAPETVLIGKREITSATLTPVVDDAAEYTITLKQGTASKEFSFTSDSSATAEEIVTGLTQLIAADTTWSGVATIAASGGTITVTPVAGTYADVDYSSNFTYVMDYANDILEDISNLSAVNNSWFYLLSDSHADQDVLDLASYVEEHDKVYFFSSQAASVADNTAGNILVRLNNLGYNNTGMALWKSDADSTFPEAAVVGSICAATPGTTTLHAKTLVGVELEPMSPTRRSNIVTNNGNIYVKEHGLLIYRDGFMVSGLYADFIIHALWFKARTEESLVSLFKQQSMLGSGVRATSSGIALIRQAVTANPINVGIMNGSIANEIVTSAETGMRVSLKPTVYIPSRADMTNAQINARLVEGMVIEYVYAGFFHYVKVQVNVLTNRTGNNTRSSNATTVS